MSFFGKNIRKIRAAKKLSQTAFANLFKIKRASIGAYEEGRAEAKINKIIEIADYFKLTLNQLLAKELTLNEIYHITDLKNKTIISDSNKIPYVKEANFNEYIKNYKNKKFINSLEKIIIPNSKKCSIAFEYFNKKGQISYSYLKQNDILLCEEIKTENIKLIKEKSIIIVISQNDIFIGRFLLKDNKLIVSYDNTISKTDEIKFNMIKCLYVVKKIIFQNINYKLI